MQEQPAHQSESRDEKISAVTSGRRVIDTFGSIIFFVIVIEIILLFGLNLYQKSRVDALTQTLSEKRAELNSFDNQELNKQIEEVLTGQDALRQVLGSKIKWANFYSRLNAVTPTNVRFTAVSVNESGAFRGDGVTTSMSDLAKALVGWQSGTESAPTPFASITLNSNGFVNQGAARLVSFSISGNVNTGGL